MSTQRNSTFQMSRGRNIAAAIAAVIAPIAASIAACSVDGPTSPMPVAHSPAFSKGASAPTPKHSDKDDQNRDTKDQIAAMAPTWHTTPADQEAGTDMPLNLACGYSGVYTVSQSVGPNGGVLRFGASSLTIPQGALSSTIQISAKITLGQGVNVEFAPHGLTFAKAATIVANYTGCTMPSTATGLNVYYTDVNGGILQSMPSAMNMSQHTVTSLTDHFSGYMVAWGRR